jgi:hypothetical protein
MSYSLSTFKRRSMASCSALLTIKYGIIFFATAKISYVVY